MDDEEIEIKACAIKSFQKHISRVFSAEFIYKNCLDLAQKELSLALDPHQPKEIREAIHSKLNKFIIGLSAPDLADFFSHFLK